MRVRIILDLENKKIPVNYRSLLQGVIYNALFGNEEIKQIHNQGYKIGKRKFKLFTFSEIYGQTSYIKETKELLFQNNAHFDFTAFYDDIVLTFINFLTQNPQIVIGKQIIKVQSYMLLDDILNNNTTEQFLTISPVTAYITDENKKTVYYHPNSEEFKESVINNIAQKYFLVYNENMPDITIDEINNIKEKKVYFRKNFAIAYHFKIIFSNLDEKVKNIIMTCGIGSKNSSGFGMLAKYNEKKNILI